VDIEPQERRHSIGIQTLIKAKILLRSRRRQDLNSYWKPKFFIMNNHKKNGILKGVGPLAGFGAAPQPQNLLAGMYRGGG